MCVDVSPAGMYICVCSPCMCTMLVPDAHRGIGFSWNWNYRWLLAAMWVLRIKPGSSEEQAVLETTETSLWLPKDILDD